MFTVGLLLSLDLPSCKSHVMTPLIGWEKDAYFITKYPYLNNKPVKIKTEDKCIIRFLKDGAAYGFETEVLSMQFHPAPLLFFKFPDSLENMPIRKQARIKINTPAKILDRINVIKKDAKIHDISENGCLLDLLSKDFEEMETSDEFYVTFKLMDKTLELDCKVRNTRMSGENLFLGLEFINQSPKNQEIIKSFIDLVSIDTT